MQPRSPMGKTDPLLDTVLLGTYRIERLLGRGGMGSVYAGTHVHLQTPCAIKVLLHEYSGLDNSEALKRFQREAQITSQLGHPNIIRVTDFNFTPDGAPFMVMELLSGETLLRRIKGRGPLSLAEVVLLFGPLCDALGLAHARHDIHRDLKPDNIFLQADAGLDAAKILDFGISKMRDGNTKLTQADVSMGTQSYMAPEIVCGAAAEADVRSDVFSMGAILYEALTGKMAYDGPNAMAVMYKLMYQPPPSAREADPSIPEAVDAVIRRALAQKPEERIQTAPDLFTELTQAAMPYLPAAEEMEAQKSNPYRYTSGSMRALRVTGLVAQATAATAAAATTPRPGTGPKALAASMTPPRGTQAGQRTFVSGPITQINAGPSQMGVPVMPEVPADPGQVPAQVAFDDIQDERPYQRKNKSGALVMGIIAGLVVLTGIGLAIVRKQVLGPQTEKAVQKEQPVPPVPQKEQPQQPAAEQAKPGPAASPAKESAKEPDKASGEADAADDKGKKHHHHHHGDRELPHLKLPTLPGE